MKTAAMVTVTDLIILACLQVLVLGGVAHYLKTKAVNTPTTQQRDANAQLLCAEHGGLNYVYAVLLKQDTEKALCNDKARFRIATGELVNPATMKCRLYNTCAMGVADD